MVLVWSLGCDVNGILKLRIWGRVADSKFREELNTRNLKP